MKGVFQKIRDPRLGDVLVPIGIPAEEALRVIKVGDKIIHSFANAQEALAAIKDGKVVVADVKGARNPLQLNLFWALVQILVDNSDFPSKEIAKRDLCIATGYTDMWENPRTGRIHIVDRSIALESMEQADFDRFFKLAVDKICDYLGNAPEEVLAEVHRMVEGQSALTRAIEKGPDPADPRFADMAPEAPGEPAEGPSTSPLSNTGVEADAAPSPAAGPPPPPPDPEEAGPAEPTTPEGYADWLNDWLGRADSEAYIEERWLAELDLRNKCGVHQDRWTHCKAMVNNRVRLIRGGKR